MFGTLGSKWQYSKINLSSINEVINIFRFLSFFILPLLLYFYLKFIKNYKFKSDIILNCFYIIFVFQLLGFANFYYFNQILYFEKLNDPNLIANGYNLRFSYSFYIALSSIVPLPLMALLLNKYQLTRNFLKISIIILSLITVIFLSKVIYDFFNSNKIYFYHLGFLTWGKVFDVAAPRATGISKWLLIIYLFIISYIYINKRENYFMIILAIFIGIFIYLFQSRTSVYFLFFSTLLIFFKEKKYFINSLKIFTIIGSILLISNLIINYKHESIIKDVDEKILIFEKELKELKELKKEKEVTKNTEETKNIIKSLNNIKSNYYEIESNRNFGNKDNFSTGRTEIWKELLNYILKRNIKNSIIGYGPQSDRYFSGQNASSGIIYVLITSGFIGLFFYLIICLRITYLFLKLFKSKKNVFNQKPDKLVLLLFSILTLIYFMLRSLVEISFMSFGMDYLFFLICYVYLRNFIKTLRNNQHNNP